MSELNKTFISSGAVTGMFSAEMTNADIYDMVGLELTDTSKAYKTAYTISRTGPYVTRMGS